MRRVPNGESVSEQLRENPPRVSARKPVIWELASEAPNPRSETGDGQQAEQPEAKLKQRRWLGGRNATRAATRARRTGPREVGDHQGGSASVNRCVGAGAEKRAGPESITNYYQASCEARAGANYDVASPARRVPSERRYGAKRVSGTSEGSEDTGGRRGRSRKRKHDVYGTSYSSTAD